jgi:hypothetical protein
VTYLVLSPILIMASVAAAPPATTRALDPVAQIAALDDQPIEQVSDGSMALIVPLIAATPRNVSSAQVASDVPEASNALQLTRKHASGRTPAQVSLGRRSAEPAPPLSRPSDGRSAAIERVSGDDRCDSSRRQEPTAACAAVIEDRAAEYARREAPTLSPEQRILIEQRRPSGPNDVKAEARRLSATGTGSELPELQGIASIVLRSGTGGAEPAPTDRAGAARTDAIVKAVLEQGGVNAPPP